MRTGTRAEWTTRPRGTPGFNEAGPMRTGTHTDGW